MDGANNYSFAATDVDTQEEIWRQNIVLTATQRGEVLAIVNDLLIAGTGRGLIALEKSTGRQIWHILKDDEFHTASVQLNNILFVKGLNRIVYAIHPGDGSIIGTVKLGNPSSFFKNYEVNAGVFRLKDGILFNTKETIYIYNN
jgi:outer membrane protein assembly factor BamB